MSLDPSPDVPEDITFGQRLKILRTRRGMSREVFGGLMGRTASWVRALETGRLSEPKLSVVLRMAEVLRLRNLSDLAGGQPLKRDLITGPGHPRLGAVRDAVNSLPALTSAPAPPVAHLRARLDQAWSARHRSPFHREVLGRLLPDLITDAQLAAHQEEDPATRRRAQAILAEVYALSQFFLAYQPAQDLLWRVAERGMVAAQDSGDVHALGIAAWLMAQAHRDAGDWDAADTVTAQTLPVLEQHAVEANAPERAMWGAMVFEAGYTAARRGEAGVARGRLDHAEQLAETLPASYYHPVTSFSRSIMGAHATTIAVELRAGGESVRQARAADPASIPSRPRRARHEIEQARAYYLDAQPEAAVRVLDAAHEAAPETIRYNGYARKILMEEMDSRDSRRRERASLLAEKVGILQA